MFTARDVLDIALRLEKNSEQFYRRASEETPVAGLGPLFRSLADEESRHGRWFEELRQLPSGSSEDSGVQEVNGTRLQDFVGRQTFSLGEADLSSLETVEEVIELAIEFENDTIIFYEMLQAFVDDPEALARLDEIIAEERRHVQLLQEHVADRRFRAGGDLSSPAPPTTP
jgi:rubrerythrin